MASTRAQGTIEYLVIIAIVVVIALVVVGLLLQVMSQGSGIPETTSKTQWKSAEPWAIVDWGRSGSILTVVLKNNSFETLDFDNIDVTASDSNGTDTSSVQAGTTITKTITGLSACPTGTKYAFPKSSIQIDFNSSTLANKVQKGVADIVGTCS